MKFKITYIDPRDKALTTDIKEFEDSEVCSASEYAEDYAYTVTDKGDYEIEVIK